MADIIWLPDLSAGDQPAGGRVMNVRADRMADGRMGVRGDFVGLPQTMQALIRGDRYPSLSSELQMIPAMNTPGALSAVALLGAAVPAVKNLQDLAALPVSDTIAGVWLVAEGAHSASDDGTGKPGTVRYTAADIERIAAMSAALERIPIRLGHGAGRVNMTEARQCLSAGETLIMEERTMDEQIQKLTEDLNKERAARVQADTDAAAQTARIAALEHSLRERDHAAMVARLSEPVAGRALPKPVADALARALGSASGVVKLAEGESQAAIIEGAMRQLLTSGLVTVTPQTVGVVTLDAEDKVKTEYEQLGGAKLGVTLDDWRKASAGGVK